MLCYSEKKHLNQRKKRSTSIKNTTSAKDMKPGKEGAWNLKSYTML